MKHIEMTGVEYFYKETRITDKKIIVWGAGNYAKTMIPKYGIRSISHIIDSTKNGSINYWNAEYPIEAPESLRDLSPDEYFIIVAVGEKFRDEIFAQIREEYSEYTNSCGAINDIHMKYRTLDSMIRYDRSVIRKIADNYLQYDIDELVEKAEKIIEDYCGSIDKMVFESIRKDGSRVVVEITTEARNYILHFPSFNIAFSIDSKTQKEFSNIRRLYGINKELLIYEDEEGFILANKAEANVDWNIEENYRKVFDEMHKLHDMEYRVNSNISFSFQNRDVETYRRFIPITFKPYQTSILNCVEYLKNIRYVETPIHADLHCGNICMYKGEAEFIDWAKLKLGNPLIDIVAFLFDSYFHWDGSALVEWEDGLELYYGRKASDKEIKDARAYMICFMLDAYQNRPYYQQEKYEKAIIKEIKKWENQDEGKTIICNNSSVQRRTLSESVSGFSNKSDVSKS